MRVPNKDEPLLLSLSSSFKIKTVKQMILERMYANGIENPDRNEHQKQLANGVIGHEDQGNPEAINAQVNLNQNNSNPDMKLEQM